MEELSEVLWRERYLLDGLEYKLECQRLLLDAGSPRFLGRVSDEIDDLLDAIGRLELSRVVAVAEAAAELGLPGDATLPELAEAAPAPWPVLLRTHHTALRGLTEAVLALASSNGERLAGGRADVEAALASLTGTPVRKEDERR